MFAICSGHYLGLKGPYAWFRRFASFVTQIGFQHNKADTSLFVFHRGLDIAYLLLYVDDIILTSSSAALLQHIIALLHTEFVMTDLRSLYYFLGVSAQRSTSGMLLSWLKFAEEILERAHMQNCNMCSAGLAGALKCLTFTQPDLSYVSNFMSGLLVYCSAYCNFLPILMLITLLPGGRRPGIVYFLVIIFYLGPQSDMLPCLVPFWQEYHGAPNVVAETAWIVLCELLSPLFTATLVYCHNVRVVYISANPVRHHAQNILRSTLTLYGTLLLRDKFVFFMSLHKAKPNRWLMVKVKYTLYPSIMAVKSAEVSVSGSIQKEKEVMDNIRGSANFASGGTLADVIKDAGGKGLLEIDVKPEIWAFGCTVFEMLTGKQIWLAYKELGKNEVLRRVGYENGIDSVISSSSDDVNEVDELQKGIVDEGNDDELCIVYTFFVQIDRAMLSLLG
ncbi:ribonuclease H-like domain-containing protein [Tanacetum coccineum]